MTIPNEFTGCEEYRGLTVAVRDGVYWVFQANGERFPSGCFDRAAARREIDIFLQPAFEPDSDGIQIDPAFAERVLREEIDYPREHPAMIDDELPYRVEQRGSYLVVDSRTNAPASYPTNKQHADAECKLLNDAYLDALQTEHASAKERMLAAVAKAKEGR